MLYLSVTITPSSERRLLSKAAPTLSLKTPCYGVFVCAVRTAYGLTRSPSIPAISHCTVNDKDGKYLGDTYRPYQWWRWRTLLLFARRLPRLRSAQRAANARSTLSLKMIH